MSDDNDKAEKVGSNYAVHELLRAMRAAQNHKDAALKAKATTRVQQWMDVLTSIASGAMKVGSRTPFSGTPAWITPGVLRGGFTKAGYYAAGGSLHPHEQKRAAELGLPLDKTSRDALHADALSEEGLARLRTQLKEGAYEVGVPEEAALLVLAWLVEKDDLKSVEKLLELISARFGELRFYPQPAAAKELARDDRPAFFGPVLFRTAEEVAKTFDTKDANDDIEAQHESISVWAPLTDAFVTLLLEVFDVEKGTTCTALPNDFSARRDALLASYDEAAKTHTHCTRPHKKGEVLRVLVDLLRESSDPRQAAWGTQGRARTRLSDFLRRYGKPGSEAHRAYREAQAKASGIPYRRFASVLSERLKAIPSGAGIEDLSAVSAPLNADEAKTSKIAEGTALPRTLTTRLQEAVEAPLEAHLVEGRIGSSEVLAKTLPQLSGHALAERFDDPAARRLYAATYRAFKRRRSLLLLWLEHQVRFQELPWVAAMEAHSDRSAQAPSQALLKSFVALALEAFPSTITPNKLVSELSALAKVSFEEPLPLVEEIASDIFMGTFTEKFLKAAKVAARMLGEDSIYARYYGLPYNRVLAMEPDTARFGKATSAAFDALGVELADAPEGNPRARNGMIIEQASILTTHNLAVLTGTLELDVGFLAPRVFNDILDMLERKVLPEKSPHRTRLKSAKNLAFAWRQMLFFLSRAKPEEVTLWHADMHALLRERSALAQERFMPVMRGLDLVIAGGRLPRWDASAPRLLGWTTTRPFLFGPDTRTSA
jgi:hypothetical protein